MRKCFVCENIRHPNKFFVKELKTGYVVLGNNQFYRGYTLFFSKVHVSELHELDQVTKLNFLKEMGKVAESVYKAFSPVKLNYELLGNLHPHLHWHIFPRYANDKIPTKPVWVNGNRGKIEPTDEEINKLKNKLLNYL